MYSTRVQTFQQHSLLFSRLSFIVSRFSFLVSRFSSKSMSFAQQIQLTSDTSSADIFFTICHTTGEKIEIMKDGRVFSWSLDAPNQSDGYTQVYGTPSLHHGFTTEAEDSIHGTCSIYRNLDEFNAQGYYYKGSVRRSNHVIEGHGEMFWPNGDSYVGDFAFGVLAGCGEYNCADGSRYLGEFYSDQIEGPGTFTWPDGTSYEGVFYNGKIERNPIVPGKITFSSDEEFTGSPFGMLKKIIDLDAPMYSCLLQRASPKDPYSSLPGRPYK